MAITAQPRTRLVIRSDKDAILAAPLSRDVAVSNNGPVVISGERHQSAYTQYRPWRNASPGGAIDQPTTGEEGGGLRRPFERSTPGQYSPAGVNNS